MFFLILLLIAAAAFGIAATAAISWCNEKQSKYFWGSIIVMIISAVVLVFSIIGYRACITDKAMDAALCGKYERREVVVNGQVVKVHYSYSKEDFD